MHKKPMTKIQFMTAAAGRRKKRAAAVLERGKKGAGGVAKSGRTKVYVAANYSELARLCKGIRKHTRGQVVGIYRLMGYAGLEGDPTARPIWPTHKPDQDNAKKKVPNDLEGDAAVLPTTGNRTDLPSK
ncbi:MAG: hypothetical protein Q7T38_02565 [Gallionella sp.]|nr:hypothetical protein [Gallionella sp.]